MNIEITSGIEVRVASHYEQEHSDPQLPNYVFSYEIEILNRNEFTVQLMRRHWIISDANGTKREVKGEGVIGKQPVLEPGQSHKYSSWCSFISEVGMMRGFFYMLRKDTGTMLEIKVPNFTILTPPKSN